MEKVRLLNYDIEEVLGESTLLVKNKDAKRKIIKQFRCPDDEAERIAEAVKCRSKTIEHSYIVGIEDAFSVGSDAVYFLCQYCEGGSLHALIKRARQYEDVINEMEVMEWLVQMILALRHLHTKGLTYGLLCPKNIMLMNNCCKLSSTELISRELDIFQRQSSHVVTPYTSPETISDPNNLTESSDIWALGCILYELCALKKLFPKASTDEEQIEDISQKPFPPFPEMFSKEMSDVWSSLMNRDKKKRPSLTDVLEMPFVAYHLKEMEETQKEENAKLLNWADVTFMDDSKTKEDISDREDRATHLPDLKDSDSLEDDESNFLTEKDIERLLNLPDV